MNCFAKITGGDTMSFAQTLKEISNPIRREILLLLKDGKMSAGDIAKHFDLTNATISYHLSQLKKAELIFEQRHKNSALYGASYERAVNPRLGVVPIGKRLPRRGLRQIARHGRA